MKSLAHAIRPTITAAAGAGWRDGLTLLEHWPAIVGDELAALCTPVQVRFPAKTRRDGTLVLAGPSAARLEVQHLTPTLLAKLNAFFGYAAISRLQLVPGVLPTLQANIKPPAEAADDSLSNALNSLQNAVDKRAKA